MMEKYGVEMDDEKMKTASDKHVCPLCGRATEVIADKPWCPTHGFEPFEKRPQK